MLISYKNPLKSAKKNNREQNVEEGEALVFREGKAPALGATPPMAVSSLKKKEQEPLAHPVIPPFSDWNSDEICIDMHRSCEFRQ